MDCCNTLVVKRHTISIANKDQLLVIAPLGGHKCRIHLKYVLPINIPNILLSNDGLPLNQCAAQSDLTNNQSYWVNASVFTIMNNRIKPLTCVILCNFFVKQQARHVLDTTNIYYDTPCVFPWHPAGTDLIPHFWTKSTFLRSMDNFS